MVTYQHNSQAMKYLNSFHVGIHVILETRDLGLGVEW
jgi:hypothetical protein